MKIMGFEGHIGRLFSSAILIGFALLMSACSKTNPGANAPASAGTASQTSQANPCSLITQEEAEIALGKGATITPSHNPRTDMDQCRLKPGTVAGIDSIIIVVHPAVGWDGVKKQLMEKSVPGLGDDAFEARALGYNVRKGDKYVQVFGPLNNENAANDKATRYIAERAASRL